MVYTIAEIGNNHNGSIEKCIKLINAAANTGANAIKIQSFTGLDISTPKLLTSDYPQWDTGEFKYWHEFTDSIALPLEDHQEVINHTINLGLDFITTPVSPNIVDFLETLEGISQYKLASMDLANYDLIEALSKTEKPIIISTGMSSLSEVHKAVSMLKDKEISILHCISDYPLNPSDASLQNIKILLDEFPNHKIGFSDHSLGKELAIIAVTLGAKIIEKHFTLDRNDKDIAEHHFSMLTDEFREMVDWLKIINTNLAEKNWIRSKNEGKGKKQYRRSFHYKSNLSKGHNIRKEDLLFLRPGNGIDYSDVDKIIGRQLSRDVFEFDCCSLSDFD